MVPVASFPYSAVMSASAADDWFAGNPLWCTVGTTRMPQVVVRGFRRALGVEQPGASRARAVGRPRLGVPEVVAHRGVDRPRQRVAERLQRRQERRDGRPPLVPGPPADAFGAAPPPCRGGPTPHPPGAPLPRPCPHPATPRPLQVPR